MYYAIDIKLTGDKITTSDTRNVPVSGAKIIGFLLLPVYWIPELRTCQEEIALDHNNNAHTENV